MLQIVQGKKISHYVDNVKFQEAMVERYNQIVVAKAEGKEPPRVSRYIGECILLIATHLAYRPNFIGYTYRDEMVSDGIENCLRYLDNYDCINYTNPFAYFTQFNFYAFIRRIQREKKQAAIKSKIIREIPFEMYDLQGHDETGEFANAYVDYLQAHDSFDTTSFDTKKVSKPKKSKETVDLSEFLDTTEDL